ncbi:MAG: Photosystem I assembly protein Ycf3 [Candidatus Methanophagaceae archaeon]|nr:MAG: Photosystem I assembly protein Ycf3 [Methanophagales archaeon]
MDDAIEDYNKAIELKPDHVEELYGIRAVIYGIKGDIGKAVEDYNKAMELNPVVDVYGSKEMFEKTIEGIRAIGFERFIKTQRSVSTELITDTEAMEHYKRGNSYLFKQEFDKAIDEFNIVIERKPNLGMVYYIRGDIYLKKGVFDKAIDDYNKVIELNPNDATAYHDRGLAYKEKGEFDKAVEDFNRAIDLINPKFAWWVYHNLGLVYVNKEEFDKAIEYFTKAIEIKTDYAEAYYNRGETYAKRNDFINCANDFFSSAFLFFLQKRGNEALKLIKATYDLKDIIDSPVCFECGAVLVAFAELNGFDPKYAEKHAKRIRDIQKHREEISESARIVLDYLVSGEVQEEIEVKDVRDDVLKSLLEGLKNRDKIG